MLHFQKSCLELTYIIQKHPSVTINLDYRTDEITFLATKFHDPLQTIASQLGLDEDLKNQCSEN